MPFDGDGPTTDFRVWLRERLFRDLEREELVAFKSKSSTVSWSGTGRV